MFDKHWYALYTTPRAEKITEQRLKDRGIETFLPLHLAQRQWSDRVKLVEMPLFSSYVFVRSTDSTVRSCIGVQGVVRIIYYDGKPAILKENEIDAMRLFLEQVRTKELTYTIDEHVLIACGPLKNISGKVKRIKKCWLLLHIEPIGLTVSVKIDQVKKT